MKPTDEDLRISPSIFADALWEDKGSFFREGTEATDPLQRGLADCYFIAALTSVALARPYIIAHKNRTTNYSQESFVDLIEFYDMSGNPEKVEVSERVPVSSSGLFLYARSVEDGEVWPAIYEKAYAKWKTGGSGDFPDYKPIEYGSSTKAMVELTGFPRTVYKNGDLAQDEIWSVIKDNCLNYITINPMTASTHSNSDENVDHRGTLIVPNHAYSILGWHSANNKKYVVLRNPWGYQETSISTDGGTWTTWDAPYQLGPGWWQSVSLGAMDGIFALGLAAFKSYFWGFGFVKES